ncbi:type II toxin-antitoxin system death-on-curing family toxin [Saccharopolyspora phatthalungensis]|uniref:Death-on-curing protein n=1 Tax=Saccharopolyspora phatthalungensis TaxID=664693 RepID=A0A840Q7G1_9PSEU|nr:type II toxin-antitoxin system death-on-curing family toxin [Saccharopolyspora phatthalungensis]MBB5155810.1 death-on-curing protein [Saccharopolyspora phatthalungensis]
MTQYLELDDLLYLISAALRQEPKSIVRDWGALESALHRPRSTVFGVDAYVTLDEKAASLLHALARNHPLLDGNKRLAWLAARMFYVYNDHDLRASDARTADTLVREVAEGKHDADRLAEVLRFWVVELQ